MFNWFGKAKSRDNEINHAIDAVTARIEAKIDELGVDSCKHEYLKISHINAKDALNKYHKEIAIIEDITDICTVVEKNTEHLDDRRTVSRINVIMKDNLHTISTHIGGLVIVDGVTYAYMGMTNWVYNLTEIYAADV